MVEGTLIAESLQAGAEADEARLVTRKIRTHKIAPAEGKPGPRRAGRVTENRITSNNLALRMWLRSKPQKKMLRPLHTRRQWHSRNVARPRRRVISNRKVQPRAYSLVHQ
jgi:hypothetical protein